MVNFNHPYLEGSSQRGALVDSQLLIVFLVGMLGAGEVEKFKRTSQYSSDDAVGINNILTMFGWVCATPHVLSEVSNILDWLNGDKRDRAREFLKNFVRSVVEEHQPARDIVDTQIFVKLGLADAGLAHLAASKNVVLITADFPLYEYSSRLGVKSINFNNFRESWLV